MFILLGRHARNLKRVLRARETAPSAVETFARLFEDETIEDDGTPQGRLRAILAVTEHRFVPGLHQGIRLGQTGFRAEYQDPWPTSADQVGHFLTAVRLSFDPRFLSNPIFALLLGAFGDTDVPFRLMIGHEKRPDPADMSRASLGGLMRAARYFRAQYKSATVADVENFQKGNLEAIAVGGGIGNSMADLRLTHKGWQFGQMIAAGKFESDRAVADWIRSELGTESPRGAAKRPN